MVGMLVICETTKRMAQIWGGVYVEELGEETQQELSMMEEASWRSCIRTLESIHQHPWDLATRGARRMSRERGWP